MFMIQINQVDLLFIFCAKRYSQRSLISKVKQEKIISLNIISNPFSNKRISEIKRSRMRQTAAHTSCSISTEHFTLIVAVVPLTPCVLKQVQIVLYFPIVQTLIQGSYSVLVSGWFEETMDTELRTKVVKTRRTI